MSLETDVTPHLHTTTMIYNLVLTLWFTETVEEQHVQAEERGNKLKQLLVKAKKDLADAKKLVGNPSLSEE